MDSPTNTSGESLLLWIKTVFTPRGVVDFASILGLTSNALYKNWFKKDLNTEQIRRIFEALKREGIPPGQILRLAEMLTKHPQHEKDEFLYTIVHKKGGHNITGSGNNLAENGSSQRNTSTEIISAQNIELEKLSKLFEGKDEMLREALDIIKDQRADLRRMIDLLEAQINKDNK